jgi:hypothetical protein
MTITAALGHKEIRYGFREGLGKGKEYPVKGGQYFHRLGGCFCHLDSNGSVVPATHTTTTAFQPIFGWACVPKDSSGHNYWKSKSSGDDGFPSKVFVIHADSNNLFEVPVKAEAVAKGDIGYSVTPASAHANSTNIQAFVKCNEASGAFIIHDVNTEASTFIVSVKSEAYTSYANVA